MRSTQDDIVAVTTNNWNYPIILCRPGKPGAWWPKRREMPYASVFDVMFYKGNLYGITERNDLVVMDIDEDKEGIPIVTDLRYVIEHPSDNSDEDDDEEVYEVDGEVWSSDEEEEMEYDETSDIDKEGEELDNDASCVKDAFEDYNATMNKPENSDGHEEVWSNEDEEEYDGDDDEESSILDEHDNEDVMLNNMEYKDMYHDGDLKVPDGITQLVDVMYDGEPKDVIFCSRHLFESMGKLLMVKRTKYQPVLSRGYNLKVEVMEVDVDAGLWIPLTDGASGTFFISQGYSKFVSTLEESGNKLIYHFVDEHDVGVDSNSQPFDPSEGKPTWFFPQELAV